MDILTAATSSDVAVMEACEPSTHIQVIPATIESGKLFGATLSFIIGEI